MARDADSMLTVRVSIFYEWMLARVACVAALAFRSIKESDLFGCFDFLVDFSVPSCWYGRVEMWKKHVALVVLLGVTLMAPWSLRAAETNTGDLKVRQVRADWLNSSGSDQLYLYTFHGDFGSGVSSGCRSMWSRSGDENVNRILQAAFSMNLRIRVGLNLQGGGCTITTVVTQ